MFAAEKEGLLDFLQIEVIGRGTEMTLQDELIHKILKLMIDTGFGIDGAIAASALKRSSSLPPKPLKTDHSSGSFGNTIKKNNEIKSNSKKVDKLPTIKDAWRWIRSIVEDLTAFEQEKQLLKEFIKNLNDELQSLDLPQEIGTASIISNDPL